MGVKRINLALQGGGAHGAFTWGVLDRLLQDDEIEIAGISGTSAGALNGAALKVGLMTGGREGARENLAWLWGQIGATGDMRLVHWLAQFGPAPRMISQAMEAALPFSLTDAVARTISPYYYGNFYANPLKRIVEKFKYQHVCHAEGPRFFVCATNVRTGKARVFTRDEITTDSILASACLPTLFEAVEIPDPETGQMEAYWDGGYTGNPALHPLYDMSLPDDIVIVNINPLERPNVPRSPQDIQNRINEVSFNSALLHDLRSINFMRELIASGRIEPGQMKDVLIHMIADDDLMRQLNVVTKSVPNPFLMNDLKVAGQAAADRFLNDCKDALNDHATVDLEAMFN